MPYPQSAPLHASAFVGPATDPPTQMARELHQPQPAVWPQLARPYDTHASQVPPKYVQPAPAHTPLAAPAAVPEKHLPDSVHHPQLFTALHVVHDEYWVHASNAHVAAATEQPEPAASWFVGPPVYVPLQHPTGEEEQ